MAIKKFDKKIIIIGSNSFSGINTIKYLLKKNFRVIGISRSNQPNKIFIPFDKSNKNYHFKKLDINKDLKRIIKLIFDFKPDYIINFAAQSMVSESWDNPTQWYETNITSQVKLFTAIQKLPSLKNLFNSLHLKYTEIIKIG